jgi:hypothetical protein
MVHLKFQSFDLALDDKRALARILTECLAATLALSEDERHLCTLQFVPYRAEDMAVGGQLARDGKWTEDGKSPLYQLEVSHSGVSRRDRKRLSKLFTDELARYLGLDTEAQRLKIRIDFRELDPKDVSVGGVWLSSLVKNGMQLVIEKVQARLSEQNGDGGKDVAGPRPLS